MQELQQSQPPSTQSVAPIPDHVNAGTALTEQSRALVAYNMIH